MSNVLKATHTGELKFPTPNGEIKISCAVLENGERVLVERSVANALGTKGSSMYWKKKRESPEDIILPEYISSKYLQPFFSDELKVKLSEPIKYLAKNKKVAFGREATILPDICDVWIQAKEVGALSSSQEKIAQNSYILMKGFANIGIIALVDEATGYQEIRDKIALQKILDRYLLKEYAKWAKRFPDEFYKEIFRLNNWQYNPAQTKRPDVIGLHTNNIVYERLTKGILDQLKRLNPKDEKGRRQSKHHQWLTDDIGHPELQAHLNGVIALMKAAPNWRAFIRLLERVYPKFEHTIPMNFGEEIE
jgi:hypothetical protein